jgi:hypothetical protein
VCKLIRIYSFVKRDKTCEVIVISKTSFQLNLDTYKLHNLFIKNKNFQTNFQKKVRYISAIYSKFIKYLGITSVQSIYCQ